MRYRTISTHLAGLALVLGAGATLGTVAPAVAQVEYPTRNVEVVIGRSAGGGIDLHARGVAPYLQRHLPGNHSVYVTNRPGAGGAVALMSVWDAEPDGYRITKTITSTDLVNTLLHEELTYRLSEFEFIGSLYYAPTGLLVRSDLNWKTLDDMRTTAAEAPLVFGTTGHGSTAHIEGLFVYDQHLGIPVRFVHYPGTADVMLAMARGEVHATSFGAHAASNFADGDDGLEMFMVWSREPVEFIEHVPTALDVGVTEEQFASAPPVLGHWRALMTTPGTPEEVMQILRKAFMDAMNDPEFDAWRLNGNFPKNAIPGDEFQKMVQEIEAGYDAIADELIELLR